MQPNTIKTIFSGDFLPNNTKLEITITNITPISAQVELHTQSNMGNIDMLDIRCRLKTDTNTDSDESSDMDAFIDSTTESTTELITESTIDTQSVTQFATQLSYYDITRFKITQYVSDDEAIDFYAEYHPATMTYTSRYGDTQYPQYKCALQLCMIAMNIQRDQMLSH